ncbi:hypothetical protein ACN27F_32810 [Solwaraspora sp. WMMB335]|uniref:hypothetical protein n=1 Tax=Solwaraspora sp. WMMB335 TaxID=3404118 RepID=UPI003B930929
MTTVRIPVWSKLTRPQRILLVVVVVLVVGYGLALGGARSTDGSAADRPSGLVGWLGDRLAGTNDADRADLSAPCLRSDTQLDVAGTCTLTVAAVDGSAMRSVRMRTDAPLVVQATTPGGDTVVSSELAAGDDLSVSVDSTGGDIGLRCRADTCTVTLLTGS